MDAEKVVSILCKIVNSMLTFRLFSNENNITKQLFKIIFEVIVEFSFVQTYDKADQKAKTFNGNR